VAFASSTFSFDGHTFDGGNYSVSFGGVEIKRRGTPDPNYPKIILTGNCAFGGVEIK
jgi:hypothetical protein